LGLGTAVTSACMEPQLRSLLLYQALLATMSKRRLGLKFKEAVITSLTALSRSRGSLTNKTVDNAVDHVFDQVFDKDMVLRNLIQDEFL